MTPAENIPDDARIRPRSTSQEPTQAPSTPGIQPSAVLRALPAAQTPSSEDSVIASSILSLMGGQSSAAISAADLLRQLDQVNPDDRGLLMVEVLNSLSSSAPAQTKATSDAEVAKIKTAMEVLREVPRTNADNSLHTAQVKGQIEVLSHTADDKLAVAQAKSVIERFEAQSRQAARARDLSVQGREEELARLARESKVDAASETLGTLRHADLIRAATRAKKEKRAAQTEQFAADAKHYGKFVLAALLALAVLTAVFWAMLH